jgi:alkyl hydroperoxide reductase subunit D
MASLEELRDALPDYAKDIKLNLQNLSGEEILSEQQKWGCFLCCAHATHQGDVIQAIESEVVNKMSPEAIGAARAAATIMAMNNVYYRSVHLVSNKAYQNLPAKLRMTVIGNPGVDKDDFELWSLAVSAVNGCGMCLDAHESQVRAHGMSEEQVQCAIRIAATVNAAASAIVSARYTGGAALAAAA